MKNFKITSSWKKINSQITKKIIRKTNVMTQLLNIWIYFWDKETYWWKKKRDRERYKYKRQKESAGLEFYEYFQKFLIHEK